MTDPEVTAVPTAATATMTFAPPVITANMMPVPNPSVEKQSAEDWFKIFSSVADNLIAIYRTANQEVVGQRQALATIPSLLNRNESEQRLSTRILQECTTVKEAETLIKKTVGNLENECQASEAVFNMKRNNRSLEDFYALLVEKGKTAKIDQTTMIKKFIAELPDNVKPSIQRKFSEYRQTTENGQLPNEQVEDLYARARQSYNDKNKKLPESMVFTADEAKEKATRLEEMLHQQNETIAELQEKLEAYAINNHDEKNRAHWSRNRNHEENNPPPWLRKQCNFCKRFGHIQRDCRDFKAEQRRKSDNVSAYCALTDNCDAAVTVSGSLNGKKKTLLIDSGAGPCVIDTDTLGAIPNHDKINMLEDEKTLKGVGSSRVIGTVILEVTLHAKIKKRQLFNVVDDLGGTVLLGRSFLRKFDKLEINWKEITLKIDDILIKGDNVIQGGCAQSRAFVAQDKVSTWDSMKRRIRELVQGYPNLNRTQKDKLTAVLIDNADLFSEDPKCPPEALLVSHVVDTKNAQPIAEKTRRFSPSMAAEIGEHVTEMLKNGICRPSKSPWSSQVLLSKKKDGSMRFVIDYRKLNDVTVKDDYPMPNIRDLIDEVNGSKYFSCMDMPSAYWHVPMDEQSIPKTAFQVPQGKYEMLRMPYGMKNSQATQQRLMDQTLESVPNTRAYVDNTFTHSVGFDEHIDYLTHTFKQLRIHNLSVRLDKCIFAQEKVEQFGLLISKSGITPANDNVTKIQEYPRPNNVKELKRFLGMSNYYREFVPKYAGIAEPLQELERKSQPYVWTEEREQAFESIKQCIASGCLLNFPDWNKPFIIELDGSKIAAGGVLMQMEGDVKKVLGFHSSTLDPAQRNYSPTELESWAAISSCRKFKNYIKGAPMLILRADHEPLQWLRKQKDPRGKFSRWIMELEHYDYHFEYKRGVDNEGPDALSRIDIGRSETDDIDPLEEYAYVVAISSMSDWKDLLIKEQKKDKGIHLAINQLETHNNIKVGRYKNNKHMFLQEGLLTKSGRTVVPNSLQYQITKDFHNLHHWGIGNTYKEIAKNYYWPGMEEYVRQYCASCDTCLRSKSANKKPKAELKPRDWADHAPGESISLDLATMTPSYDGFKYIMLITDGMSKFSEICPLRNMTAPAVVKNIERNWIARHGVPSTLLTDQGAQVDGEEVRELCNRYNIEKKRSSPYHPEGDGISERPIGVMKGLFRRKICDKNIPQRKWTDLVPEVQLAMNQKVHSATDASPFQLMYGEDRRFDTNKPQLQGPFSAGNKYNQDERNLGKQIHINQAKTNLKAAAEKMKKQYDKSSSEEHYTVGDQVYIRREYAKAGTSKKLSTVFDNLSTITESNHPIYKVKQLGSGKKGWIHHNRLRKKENLLTPQIRTKFTPKLQSELPTSTIDQDDDNMTELDFPIIINNSHIPVTHDDTPLAETVGDEEQIDEIPIVSLGGPETGAQTIDDSLENPPTERGLIINDEGRRVSTRTRIPTTNKDFKY